MFKAPAFVHRTVRVLTSGHSTWRACCCKAHFIKARAATVNFLHHQMSSPPISIFMVVCCARAAWQCKVRCAAVLTAFLAAGPGIAAKEPATANVRGLQVPRHRSYPRDYLELQVAQNKRPLYLRVAQKSLEVSHNYGPLAFQVRPNLASLGDPDHLLAFLREERGLPSDGVAPASACLAASLATGRRYARVSVLLGCPLLQRF